MGKIAVVTGASGGLGSHICRQIALRGISLVLLDRQSDKATAFAASLAASFPTLEVDSIAIDLADHRNIREVTQRITQRYPKIHYLFNNAGVLTDTLQFSKYNNELHFEVNTLAALQLIDQLRPSLAGGAPSVVVNTSAGLSLNAKTLQWKELVRPTTFRKLYGPYVNSKAALNVLTAALAGQLASDGIQLRAADPGPNQTALTKGPGTPLWMRLFYAFLPKPDKGAEKIVNAGFSPEFESMSGVFLTGGKVKPLPPALSGAAFQDQLLQRCRAQAAAEF